MSDRNEMFEAMSRLHGMTPKPTTMSIDLAIKPSDAVFPMRVVIGELRYEFRAKIIRRRRLKTVDRFDLEVVGAITMSSARKPKRKGTK